MKVSDILTDEVLAQIESRYQDKGLSSKVTLVLHKDEPHYIVQHGLNCPQSVGEFYTIKFILDEIAVQLESLLGEQYKVELPYNYSTSEPFKIIKHNHH